MARTTKKTKSDWTKSASAVAYYGESVDGVQPSMRVGAELVNGDKDMVLIDVPMMAFICRQMELEGKASFPLNFFDIDKD